MPFWSRGGNSSRHYDAISRSHALIWFAPDGTIRGANANFCAALGYSLQEISGRHHSMFVDPAEAALTAYRQFWADLADGRTQAGAFRRLSKTGADVWIEAAYTPVLQGGKTVEVLKIAADITTAKIASLHNQSKLSALDQSLAVIEFTLDGTVVTANENFCRALDYGLDEIRGRKHALFCTAEDVASPEYARHWERLRKGELLSDTYLRIGKSGQRVWLQASYNPLFNAKGEVYGVVKFATDITARMRSVDVLGAAIGQLAEGNLVSQVREPLDRSVERTRQDFNAAVTDLARTIGEIAATAHDIAGSAHEMTASAGDIARRTEQQAASIEQTAAALDEITHTVADTSRRAADVGRIVRETREEAEKSGRVVNDAVEAMGEIARSSGRIASIIGVIDDIAFQTNLLALNAGVEAARAGEAGKGFAVVAQEVRELAQRSANAAKEIKALIELSSGQVKNGVALVGLTGEALTSIAGRVQDIDGNIAAIVEAAREQAVGVREIGQAVNLLDQGTQQNAATAEEQNAGSHQLSAQADALAALLARFRIDGGGTAGHAMAERPAVTLRRVS